MLVCWCVGVLVCWCVGVLVCWCVGVLVCWCVGLEHECVTFGTFSPRYSCEYSSRYYFTRLIDEYQNKWRYFEDNVFNTHVNNDYANGISFALYYSEI